MPSNVDQTFFKDLISTPAFVGVVVTVEYNGKATAPPGKEFVWGSIVARSNYQLFNAPTNSWQRYPAPGRSGPWYQDAPHFLPVTAVNPYYDAPGSPNVVGLVNEGGITGSFTLYAYGIALLSRDKKTGAIDPKPIESVYFMVRRYVAKGTAGTTITLTVGKVPAKLERNPDTKWGTYRIKPEGF